MYNLGGGHGGPYISSFLEVTKVIYYFGGGMKLRRRRSEDRHPNYTLPYYSSCGTCHSMGQRHGDRTQSFRRQMTGTRAVAVSRNKFLAPCVPFLCSIRCRESLHVPTSCVLVCIRLHSLGCFHIVLFVCHLGNIRRQLN